LKQLRVALPDYQYQFNEGVAGGAAVFSRVPIERQATADAPYTRRFGVRGVVHFGKEDLLIIAEHPPDPLRRTRAVLRNAEFERLANELHGLNKPVVVIGDLNATPWSPYFENLLERGGLHDSELGFGVQPTWNKWMVLPMVPIDHCLANGLVAITNRDVGPDVGSDHLPLCVDVSLTR
jgi:endonuclease/exonuclease/phosphatase (EEP) superfamily protein YafD